MGKLYSVSIYWGGYPPQTALVESAFNSPTDDWIRFSGSQWFVWSETPIRQLSTRLRTSLGGVINGQLVITQLEPVAAHGGADQWIWDWLNDKMSKQMDAKFKSGS